VRDNDRAVHDGDVDDASLGHQREHVDDGRRRRHAHEIALVEHRQRVQRCVERVRVLELVVHDAQQRRRRDARVRPLVAIVARRVAAHAQRRQRHHSTLHVQLIECRQQRRTGIEQHRRRHRYARLD
jgi:hypothetical protein